MERCRHDETYPYKRQSAAAGRSCRLLSTGFRFGTRAVGRRSRRTSGKLSLRVFGGRRQPAWDAACERGWMFTMDASATPGLNPLPLPQLAPTLRRLFFDDNRASKESGV